MAGEPREIRGFFRILFTLRKPDRSRKKRSAGEVREMMLRHAKLQMEYKGDYTAIREMRKHVAWYTTGISEFCQVAE